MTAVKGGAMAVSARKTIPRWGVGLGSERPAPIEDQRATMPMGDTGPGTASGGLALTLFGGGARAAYQVGVLRGLARGRPDLRPSILVGISAGAINAAHLGNRVGSFEEKTAALTELWRGIDVERVFETRPLALLHRAACIGLRLATGWAPTLRPLHGLVDSAPLAQFLGREFGGRDLAGIRENLASGDLDAIALVALQYATGRTISFYAGRDLVEWDRPLRRGERVELGLEHVLASSALPLFFPPTEIGGEWYGDGGVRLSAPLAPAVHLGAERILAVSPRYRPSGDEASMRRFEGAPRAAQILGNLMSATFLDVLDQDALHLERINGLVERLPEAERMGLRPIRCLVIRPSRDIAALANDFEPRLPFVFRFLTRRWGTKRARTQELLSTILFQEDYVRALLEVGEEDGERNVDALAELLDDQNPTASPR